MRNGPIRSRLSRLALAAGTLAAGHFGTVLAARAQVAEPAPAAAKLVVVTPHAPLARRIQPLVPRLQRGETPSPSALTAVKAVTSKLIDRIPSPQVPALAKSKFVAGVQRSHIRKGVVAAPSVTAAAVAAPAASAATANATPRPTFVAYTCRIGEDYSVERKTCFVPRPAKAAAVTDKGRTKSKSAHLKKPFDQTGRSALGAKN